jgi:hypothetical protein
MKVSALLWPFPFGLRVSWATTKVCNPDPQYARGRVFLLRGNGIVFSRGMGILCDTLRGRGTWAEDLRCMGDRWARRHLLAQRDVGKRSGPVIFVGHSCGGRYALHAAHALEPAGLTVDLIVCIDVAFPPEVPGNVKRAVHIYLGGPRLYPARPLRPAPGSAARIENRDLRAPGSPIDARGLHHLNITGNPSVQAFVLARVEEALGS